MDIVFDIETDGLEATTIHCIGVSMLDSGIGQVFANVEPYDCLQDALDVMSKADTLIGHNILNFDLPWLKKLLGWEPSKHTVIRDTLILSRLCHPNLMDVDEAENILPKKLWGSHSLKAWGMRLKENKIEYEDNFSEFRPQMAEYCMQDVRVQTTLYYHFLSLDYAEEAVNLEHEFALIINRQVAHGFKFDTKKAAALYVELLGQRTDLEQQLKNNFGIMYLSEGQFTPKKDNKKRGYTKGGVFTKIKPVPFNPNSRDQIARHLQQKYSWTPKEYTEGGRPKIDETILSKLSFPYCKELKEFFLVAKRISQLAEGESAWLKLEKKGRIHGKVNTNGAVTGRCTHNSPNVAQVPAVYSQYGKECRDLFTCSKNKVLVGCDADGLELRALAGYMRKYDGGAYVEAAVSGNKELGTDIHSINRDALGISDRDVAKTWFYAFIYGAGDSKLGAIMGLGASSGKSFRRKFLKNVTGLEKLTSLVQQVYNRRGYLFGLDGRKLYVRSKHKALNTLLQSAGAVLMKKALCILDNSLRKELVPGHDYEFVANIHDEFQIEVDKQYAELVAREAEEAITKAGEYFEFGCPLSATSKIGRTWAETH